jgi:hypothetical protein
MCGQPSRQVDLARREGLPLLGDQVRGQRLLQASGPGYLCISESLIGLLTWGNYAKGIRLHALFSAF